MAAKPSIGGQAVIEGVMMRGPASWAVAVRKSDDRIVCETFGIDGSRRRWWRWPFLRGMHVLVESLVIGMRALKISAGHALDEGEESPAVEAKLGWTMGLAMVVFAGVFIALPAFATKLGGRALGLDNDLAQNLVEGAIRIGLFLGYILAISLIPDVRRVFQYHGAEHKTIYAYENGDPLDPEVVDRYSTLHVRCGTNFLFVVMFLTIGVHLVLDLVLPASIPLRIGARVMAVPVLAGLAYEVIKAASRDERSLVFRAASIPGLALQKITTRPPSRDQIEVAIRAMEAVVEREGLAPAGGAGSEAPEARAPRPLPGPEPGAAPATPG